MKTIPESVPADSRELYNAITDLRRVLKVDGAEAKRLKEAATRPQPFGGAGGAGSTAPVSGDRGEAIANITLAYRHIEDASMRLGKALQALDGGASVYDKETTVGA